MRGPWSDPPGLETPLGRVEVALAIARGSEPEWSRLGEAVWETEAAGATVRVALVDLPREFGPHLVLRRWGILATVAPRDPIPEVEMRVGYDSAPVGGWSNGESLACLMFDDDDDAVVAIGGPDNEEIARRIAAGSLPASWAEHLLAGRPLQHGVVGWIEDGSFSPALSPDVSGLSWRFPALAAGESCDLTAIVAVAPTEPATTAAWYAVDVPYEELSALPTANRGTGEGRAQ